MPPTNVKPRLFQNMSPENVALIEKLGRRMGYVKGRVVFTEGLPANEAILLIEGRMVMTVGQGEEQVTVGDVWPGEIAGERSFLSGSGVHQVTVTAAANSRGLLLSRAAIEELEETWALVVIQQHMVQTLLRRLQGTDQAVRKSWQEVRSAKARAASGADPAPDSPAPNLMGTMRSMINKFLGGAS